MDSINQQTDETTEERAKLVGSEKGEVLYFKKLINLLILFTYLRCLYSYFLFV